jgi:hypothetical protein
MQFFSKIGFEIRYLKHSPNCVLTFNLFFVKPYEILAVNKTRLTKVYDTGIILKVLSTQMPSLDSGILLYPPVFLRDHKNKLIWKLF